MLRPLSTFPALLALTLVALPAVAADPTPVERSIAVQKSMATARQFLDVGMSAEALTALEPEIPNADGSKAFLTLLREAYLAELSRLERADPPNAARATQIRRNLSLLGGVIPAPKPPAAPPPPPVLQAPVADTTADAVAAFKLGDYATASRLFATALALTADQKAAWAYCRIKLAADRVNAPQCDAATAATALREVTEALQLVPQHTELQKVGQTIIATANQKAKPSGVVTPPVGTGDVLESASFRVHHTGERERAESVAKAAEAQRKVIFERWSGPAAGGWTPKCDIIIHPSAEAYVKATGRPAGTTGAAAVRLTDGRATERRIDLRADDKGIESNALPRELTHIVLADLFPDKSPPKWAVEGMAILAGSPEEIGRYTRTLPRCARDGDWFGLAQLLELKDFPAEKITGFYCQSVSLTEYLITAGGGERNFTQFLRDTQRYGTPQALKRQFNIDGPPALETAWKRAALEVGRGQGP